MEISLCCKAYLSTRKGEGGPGQLSLRRSEKKLKKEASSPVPYDVPEREKYVAHQTCVPITDERGRVRRLKKGGKEGDSDSLLPRWEHFLHFRGRKKCLPLNPGRRKTGESSRKKKRRVRPTYFPITSKRTAPPTV